MVTQGAAWHQCTTSQEEVIHKQPRHLPSPLHAPDSKVHAVSGPFGPASDPGCQLHLGLPLPHYAGPVFRPSIDKVILWFQKFRGF